MKTVAKVFGVVILLVLLGMGGAVGYFYGVLPKVRKAPDVRAPTTPEAVARGEYLFNHVAGCAGCHSQVDDGASGEPIVAATIGGGRDFGVIAGFPGHIVAPNITPDREHGIGNWTDGEILRALREGISKDGRALFPIMPYPTFGKNLSDEDALAIIAYVRTLPPLPSAFGKTKIDFPISMFARAAPKPVETPAGPPPKDKVDYGLWLMAVASCHDCHTPMERGKLIPGKDFAGGMKFELKKGTFYTANITTDASTGIGAWSDDDILRVFNEGKDKSGRELYGMPWRSFSGMTDDDKAAIVAALHTVKAINNVVPAAVIK